MAGSFIMGKRLGRVAEFCPMCRSISRHELFEAAITAGQAMARGFAVRCVDCGFAIQADNNEYISVENDPATALEELISRTNPRVGEKLAGRLALEELVKDGRVDVSEREELIREPLRLLATEIEDPPGGERVGILFIVGLALFFVLLVAAFFLPKDASNLAAIGAFGSLALTFLLIPILAVFSPIFTRFARKRHLRESVVPSLARSLAPLNPSLDEIDRAVAGLLSLGLRGMRYMKASEIHREIQKQRKGFPS